MLICGTHTHHHIARCWGWGWSSRIVTIRNKSIGGIWMCGQNKIGTGSDRRGYIRATEGSPVRSSLIWQCYTIVGAGKTTVIVITVREHVRAVSVVIGSAVCNP